MGLTIVSHPLLQHKLTMLRCKTTATAEFRQLVREIAFLLGYEVTRDLKLRMVAVETPMEVTEAPVLQGKKLVLASILRAGEGLLLGMLDLLPAARVCHIGLYRDHETLEAVEYYFKAPERLDERLIILVDPMLATGNSAVKAVDELKRGGAKAIRFVCILSAPEGVAHLQACHPDVDIYTAALDRGLSEAGYILPGLGDAGDRMFGTK